MRKKGYLCPVCGFDGLKEPPYNQQSVPSYEICPCCGFEPGFDSEIAQDKLSALRQRWIDSGANWFMPNLKPRNWDMRRQLSNLGTKNNK